MPVVCSLRSCASGFSKHIHCINLNLKPFGFGMIGLVDGVKTAVLIWLLKIRKRVNKCVKEDGGSLDGYYLAHRAKKLWLNDNPGKTERD